MATITITFPQEYINETTALQLVMTITKTSTGNQSVNAIDQKLIVTDYGSYQVTYGFEDAMLGISSYSVSIGDSLGYLEDLLFDNDDTNKNPIVELKKTVGATTTTLFKGMAWEDSISYEVGTKTLKITARPQTDIIKKKKIYLDGVYTAYDAPLNFNDATYTSLNAIFTNIYKLVNTSVTLNFETTALDFLGLANGGFSNNLIEMSDLLVLTDPLFFVTPPDNYADVLKLLSQEFFCYTGMLSNDKAFVKTLLGITSATQTGTVLSHTKKYDYNLIDYVMLDSFGDSYTAGVFTDIEGRFIERDVLSGCYYNNGSRGTNIKATYAATTGLYIFGANPRISGLDIPTFQGLGTGTIYKVDNDANKKVRFVGEPYGRELTPTPHPQYAALGMGFLLFELIDSFSPPSSGTLYLSDGEGASTIPFNTCNALTNVYYDVYACKMQGVYDYWRPFGRVMANVLLELRGNINRCRVDSFELSGIDFDYLKDFEYNDKIYKIFNMQIDFNDFKTKIDALYMGDAP